jgi:hypothetical protein
MSVSASVARPALRRGPRRTRVATCLAVLLALAAVGPAFATSPVAAPRVPAAVPGQKIIVTYRDDASYRAAPGPANARETERLDALRMRVFRANPGQERRAMRELAAARGVAAIESDVAVESTLTPNDPLWPSRVSWAHDKLSLRTAWSTTRGTSDTIIAILDSGLETSHPEFSGRVLAGYDFVEGDTVPNDPRGHGTMSAGAAAARGNNGIGVAGACWNCKILPVRVLNANGSGYASSVTRAIVWATNKGADVISMSFGGFSPTTSMANAVQYARDRGVTVVASAGNDGSTRAFYPASYAGVIGVAASDPSDRVYSWSNRGNRFELTAPGCFWTTKTGRTYGNFCGTSASTPLVAGLFGLLHSVRPDLKGYLIERAVMETATPMWYVQHGRPNAAAALKRTLAMPQPAPSTHAWVENNGRVVVEAERANRRIGRSGSSWINGTVMGSYVGSGYVACWTDRGAFYGDGYATTAPELQYKVKFSTPGTYWVWFRTRAVVGGDSVHLGTNGEALAATDKITTGIYGHWAWTRSTMDGPTARIYIDKPGIRTINVWCREDGFRFDRLVITKGYAPVGEGPAESPTIRIPLS